jgi:hypothetical protein
MKISKITQSKIDKKIEEIKSNIKRISDLSDCSREHIAKLISEGCHSGEICESVILEIGKKQFEEEIYGWWSIGNGRIEISI